jgi:hypothetical protein
LCASGADEEKIERELKGKTLQVYWHILKSAGTNVGVRKVQRALRFSSPTLAAYHLDKLVELGLVKKEHGEYRLVKEVKVGVFRQFMKFGPYMLPRYVFYTALFSTLLILYVVYVFNFEQFNLSGLFAFVFGILGAVVSLYETFRAWRESRRF